jgi:hypothetical protein
MTKYLKNQIKSWTESQAFFTIFKLPVYIFTAVLGFIFEFIYELPFMLVCMLSAPKRK